MEPLSEHTSTLAEMQVHSQGKADGLPGPLPPTPYSLELQCQKLSTLQVDDRISGPVPSQLLSVSSWNTESSTAVTMCTVKLTLQITYWSQIKIIWPPNAIPVHLEIQ